jgi:hypothetical protein
MTSLPDLTVISSSDFADFDDCDAGNASQRVLIVAYSRQNL